MTPTQIIGTISESYTRSRQEASVMAIASTTYPSSGSNMPLFGGPASDMTDNQLQATWQAVAQQAQDLPSDQREGSEDAALMQMFRSGRISANDLDSLLTKAADQNPQVDPGKQAVDRLEAEGVKLTGQQKDAIEKSARNQAAQAKVADAEGLLNMERSAPGQASSQALSIGITVFDANGNQQHLLVRNTGPGSNSIQQIHDLGNGYRDQVLIDAAEDHLEAEMAATPPDQRKKLSEKVHAPGGTYDVTLDTNGKLSVELEKETGFWGSILHGLEAVAPIALAAIPGVGPVAAAAYLGAKGGYDIANGNIAGGIADIAGGMTGVGGFIGGATGSAIQDAATAAQYGDKVYQAASSGNVWGAINTAVGAVPGVAGLAGDLGASNDFVDTAQAAAGEIGTAARVVQAGQAEANAIEAGNVFGGVSGFAALAPKALSLFGNAGNDLASSLQPALNGVAEAARLGQTVQSTVTAAQQGNVFAAISDAASAATAALELDD
jgi:hypothetical protein